MNDSFLLKTSGAIKLYNETAKNLPIIDFHNHLSPSELCSDRYFENMTELWLSCDPYKHRLMRICGVPERFITGDSTPQEKFKHFCNIFPLIAGNPVYDWSKMELYSIFGINEAPCAENADRIYAKCNEMLKDSAFCSTQILKRFNIEYQSPVFSICDDISALSDKKIAPSLRGDNLLLPDNELIKQLEAKTGKKINDTASFICAVGVMLDKFSAGGCRFADHALDAEFFDEDEKKQEILILLAHEYAKRGWTLLLHLDAKRKTSARLRELAGAAGGYAAVGGSFNISKLCDLLGKIEATGALCDTILFPLNLSDQAPLAVMQGSFSQDNVASKVQLGPAWWWCDHALGIKNTFEVISSFGALSQFIGMTTDSRSILSFIRHDYFRRILCGWLDEKNCEWELSEASLKKIVENVCYQNAKNKIERGF